MPHIKEKDWKLLRSMKDEKLAFFCDRVFAKLDNVIKNKGTESHQAYRKLWKTLRREDDKIAAMFDDLKRSNAVRKLGAWRRYGILTDEELQQFSEETRNSVVLLSEL